MGRAVLIICAGVLVMLGYVGLGSLQQSKQVIGGTASYTDKLRAKNAAQTAIQIAMNEINKDENWGDDKTKENPWVINIDNSEIHLYVESIYEESDPDKFFEPDTIQLVSTANYQDSIAETETSTRIVSVFVTSAIDEFVQKFKGAVMVTVDDFSISSDGGNVVALSGVDSTGQCTEKPALSVINETLISKVEDHMPPFDLNGELLWDQTSSYNITQELVERLETQEEVTFLKNSYKGSIGTESDPGVFFVESSATLTGGVENGYGILVFRSGGSLAMVDSLGNPVPVSENLTFHGLSVFEDAYELDIKNIPSINGMLIIGKTEDAVKDITVKLNGDIRIQYDCSAEAYVKKAAAGIIPYKRYRLVSTFE